MSSFPSSNFWFSKLEDELSKGTRTTEQCDLQTESVYALTWNPRIFGSVIDYNWSLTPCSKQFNWYIGVNLQNYRHQLNHECSIKRNNVPPEHSTNLNKWREKNLLASTGNRTRDLGLQAQHSTDWATEAHGKVNPEFLPSEDGDFLSS